MFIIRYEIPDETNMHSVSINELKRKKIENVYTFTASVFCKTANAGYDSVPEN